MIIDRSHPEVIKKARPNYQQFVSFRIQKKNCRLYFSVGAVNNFGMELKHRVTFEDLGDMVLVWFNYSGKGFALYHEETKGLWIANSGLVRVLTKKRKVISGQHFYIGRITVDEIKTAHRNWRPKTSVDLFHILLDKSIEEYQKDFLNNRKTAQP